MEAAREWLRRAQSDLALARAKPEGVYLEDLCFHAQQAAEKAIKALLIRRDIKFPYTHDLGKLLSLLEQAASQLPDSIRQAERLTRFAVEARYPGIGSPVSEERYREALGLALEVVRWVEGQIRTTRP